VAQTKLFLQKKFQMKFNTKAIHGGHWAKNCWYWRRGRFNRRFKTSIV